MPALPASVAPCRVVSIARPVPHTLIDALRSPEGRVRAGFPSPGDDYDSERLLDIHDLLAVDAASTFWVQTEGESMQGAGIDEGDFLCVDRSLAPVNHDVVVAVVDGTMVVKTYRATPAKWGTPYRVWLECAPPSLGQILPEEGMEIFVWGVVTGVVKVMERAQARADRRRRTTDLSTRSGQADGRRGHAVPSTGSGTPAGTTDGGAWDDRTQSRQGSVPGTALPSRGPEGDSLPGRVRIAPPGGGRPSC